MRRVFADDRVRAAAFVFLTVAAVGVVAYLAVMTGFRTYDDEGYFLVNLRGYNHGVALYQEINSPYGPFYWQFMGGIFAATGTTIDHDSGRIVTLLLWCGTAGLSAATIWRLTRSVLVSCGVAALVMQTLYLFPGEPLHPGALIALFLAALAFVFARGGQLTFAYAGILVAALLLMKVNIGCFALLAVLFAMTTGAPRSSFDRWWRRALTFAFCAVPLGLMLPQLDTAGFLPFGLHITLVATAFAIVASVFPLASGETPRRSHVWFLASFAGFAIIDVLLTWSTSSSLTSIWTDIVRNAISQPNLFAFPPVESSAALIIDLISVGAAATAWVNREALARWSHSRKATLGIGAVRLAGGSLTWLAMTTMHAPLALPVSAAWLAAIPSALDDGRRRWTIRAIAAVALLQTLHAYPVAGSQRGWGSFMLILVAGILINDGAREVGSILEAHIARGVVVGITGVASAEAILVALVLAFPTYLDAFRTSAPLHLPGARLVRADPETVAGLQAVTAAIDDHCGTFISMPGLGSFYSFARKTPPTLLAGSAWMLGVDEGQQQRAVQEVSATKNVCVLLNDGLVSFWLGTRPLPNRPLVKYVQSHTSNPISLPGGYNLAFP